jgi:opacity protein-like surface antigen
MYSIGLGMDYSLNPHLLMSLGYEYANLGNVATGFGTSSWSSNSLQFGKLTTNTVLFNIDYQFSQ